MVCSPYKKLSFGAVMALVFGSQIGSGIFVLPASLSQYGMFGILGWAFAGLGAILIALVFAELCSRMPKTGGPHVYVYEAFGKWPAFFVGWMYWLVSWVSTSIVVITAITYLHPFIGQESTIVYFSAQMILLSIITALNCFSVECSGKVEFALTLMKFIPFVIVPLIVLPNFDLANIEMSNDVAQLSITQIASTVTVLCFWGFIGVECATAPADCVENPSCTIPKAIVFGTISVVLIYIINSAAIIGAVPAAQLALSKAPYVDAISNVIGKNTSLIMSVIASVACIGALNAWVLASAQISLGLAQDGLLPKFFAKKNTNGAPYISVLISCLGMIPILALTADKDLATQINAIVDFSVISFIFVYLACSLALLKILLTNKTAYICKIIAILSILFCSFMIFEASTIAVVVSLLFMLSGVLVIPFLKK